MQIEKGYIRIDGKTTPEQRNYFCNKFQTKDSLRVAILSICAANAGLNLSAASLVIFGELFWNPGVRFLKSLISSPTDIVVDVDMTISCYKCCCMC